MAALVPAGTRAQSASAPELKAVLLLNFARFATWPGVAPDAPIVLCVFGDDRVAEALSTAVRGQHVDGRSVEASPLKAGAPATGCHLLFVSGTAIDEGTPMLDSARALPVLTVSDAARFSQTGGIVELFVEDGRMRFAVNLDAAARSQVRLSSRLLGLARIVRDDHVQ